MKLFQVTQRHSNLPIVDGDWETVPALVDAELVVFWGGEDVNPKWYGERPNSHVADETGLASGRDAAERIIYRWAVELKKPILGICRGSQFVTVMNGGRLYQHVNNHALAGTHLVYDIHGRSYRATSTHHQMMRPPDEDAVLIAWANEATRYIDQFDNVVEWGKLHKDVETVWYPKTRTLAIQGHPEYQFGVTDFREAASFYMRKYLFGKD